jgi:hypothetical protein
LDLDLRLRFPWFAVEMVLPVMAAVRMAFLLRYCAPGEVQGGNMGYNPYDLLTITLYLDIGTITVSRKELRCHFIADSNRSGFARLKGDVMRGYYQWTALYAVNGFQDRGLEYKLLALMAQITHQDRFNNPLSGEYLSD